MKTLKSSPSLRFIDFNEPWERKSLRKVSFIGRGKSRHRPRDAEFLYGGEYPFVQTGDIRNAGVYLDSYTQTYSEEGLKQSKLWNEETLCVTIAANIAETAILKIKACFPDSIIGLVPFADQSSALFIKYQFDNFQIGIQNLAQGVAQANLNQEKLSNIEFSFPSISEQQKIATFLTAVDDKIQQLSNKKALLEKYKKGIMQQIFNQEIRFKGDNGQNYPEWEIKSLGEITSMISNGLSLAQNSLAEGFRVTRIETISEKSINLNKVGYISTDQDISGYKLKIGDVLFSNINSAAHIGKLVLIKADYDLYHGMNLLRLQFDTSKYNPPFLAYQLGSKEYKNYFEMICNRAVNQASINQSDLKKTRLRVPQLAEQTKIANFLSALDDKIGHVDHQLELTKLYKKGLLQQMFV